MTIIGVVVGVILLVILVVVVAGAIWWSNNVKAISPDESARIMAEAAKREPDPDSALDKDRAHPAAKELMKEDWLWRARLKEHPEGRTEPYCALR